MVVCTICHADAECIVELNSRTLRISYICYKDLGPGLDARHPKWLSLLTGEGYHNRPEHELDLYARVWHISSVLGSRGLAKVIHKTPHGLFDVRSEDKYSEEISRAMTATRK